MSDRTAIELLKSHFPEASNSSFRKWIKFGRVKIGEVIVSKANELFKKDATLSLLKKEENALPFKVLFEDPHLIVVHKPDYLLSVASEDPKERSVHGELKKKYSSVIYPVHRLDRHVTGPLIFAKTKQAYETLKEAFYEREVSREYRALVHGRVESSQGTWESCLEEKKGYKMHASEGRGKHAVTHYEVLEYTKTSTLLKLTLETGRKNQLRVHTKESGHPIYGDQKYGHNDGVNRIALYACSLRFQHPITKKTLYFDVEAPFTFKKLQQMLSRVS